MPRVGQRQSPGIATLLLLYQLFQVGIENVPPVTLGSIAFMSALFYKPDAFLEMLRLPSLEHACLSVMSVWHYGDWKRLVLAGFFHINDWHLYYNMTSLLWKGMNLEPAVGSGYFLCLLGMFSIVCNVVLLVLSSVMAQVFNQPSYLMDCSAGFSGVLFALKVVVSYMMPATTQYIMGIPINSRFACWIELLVIQILVPNASFLGHLAGILVGLAYIFGPLKDILDWIWRVGPTHQGANRAGYQGNRAGHHDNRGYNAGNRPTTAGNFAFTGRPSYTYASGPTGFTNDNAHYRPPYT